MSYNFTFEEENNKIIIEQTEIGEMSFNIIEITHTNEGKEETFLEYCNSLKGSIDIIELINLNEKEDDSNILNYTDFILNLQGYKLSNIESPEKIEFICSSKIKINNHLYNNFNSKIEKLNNVPIVIYNFNNLEINFDNNIDFTDQNIDYWSLDDAIINLTSDTDKTIILRIF